MTSKTLIWKGGWRIPLVALVFAPHILQRKPSVVSLNALRKWKLWSLDVKEASSRADRFDRDVFLHAPEEWDPACSTRVWELKAPAYGLNDAPVAFRRSLKRHLSNSELPAKSVGIRCQVSPSDFGVRSPAAEVLAAHRNDFSGWGEPGALATLRHFSGATIRRTQIIWGTPVRTWVLNWRRIAPFRPPRLKEILRRIFS